MYGPQSFILGRVLAIHFMEISVHDFLKEGDEKTTRTILLLKGAIFAVKPRFKDAIGIHSRGEARTVSLGSYTFKRFSDILGSIRA